MLHLDGIIFSLQRQGGISVYFRELLQRMRRDGLALCMSLEAPLQQTLSPALLQSAELRDARRLERYRRVRPLSEPRAARLFHSSYYRLPPHPGLPTVVTIHDFAYERTQGPGPRRWVHSWQKHAAIRQAQHLICISEATRQDLEELVGLRPGQTVHVIHNGVSDRFRPLGDTERAAAPARPFVLFVGQRGGYKNFQLLLRALEHLPEDIELLCIGGGPLQPIELAALPEAQRARVRHLGYVDDEGLNRCYNQALCLAYVSGYEGFGIPVIEAMRAGCPVLGIACKAVQEVGGAALRVAEAGGEALAAAVLELAEPAQRAARIRDGQAMAARYSWEHTYQQTAAVYRAVAQA